MDEALRRQKLARWRILTRRRSHHHSRKKSMSDHVLFRIKAEAEHEQFLEQRLEERERRAWTWSSTITSTRQSSARRSNRTCMSSEMFLERRAWLSKVCDCTNLKLTVLRYFGWARRVHQVRGAAERKRSENGDCDCDARCSRTSWEWRSAAKN